MKVEFTRINWFGVFSFMVCLAGMCGATITVDKDYTFNSGPEAGLAIQYRSGSEAPVYTDGQVVLPPDTYLIGTNLFALQPTNFGVEIILTQTSDTYDHRWVLDTSAGYQLSLNGKSGWSAADDSYDSWSFASGVVTGTQYRLAIVVSNSTTSGESTATFYRDGVYVESRTGLPGEFPSYALTNLMLGAANRTELTGQSDTPSVISINEVRLFHFDEGQFDPANDLLTQPTVFDVTVTSPFNSQMFLTGTSITAVATIHYGEAPYSVTFYTKRDGDALSPGTSVYSPPYEASLGQLSAGSYIIYAEVYDVTNGMAISPTNTFSVAEPAIVIDRQYTFNNGPEADLATFYRSGSDDPVYRKGQVILGPETYLMGTNLYALRPVDFGVEVIASQTSGILGQQRWVLDTAALGGEGFHFSLLGQHGWVAGDDAAGIDLGTAAGVTTGMQARLALVTMGNPDGSITEVFYRDGASVASRTGARGEFVAALQSNLWVGAANRTELTGWSYPPCTIAVDEIRLFHFAPGRFSPSLLLAEPTPMPLTADFGGAPTSGPAPLTVTFADTSIPGATGAINTRYWEFGDGVSVYTSATNLTHTYTGAGAYNVQLVVWDDAGAASTNVKANFIVVAPPIPPAANFSASPTNGEFPLSVTFTDSSTPGSTDPIVMRYWDFGDGETLHAVGTSVIHIYTEAGTYDVELVVGDGVAYGTNSQPALITVEPQAASYRESVLRDGPIAYYEMNETGGLVATDTMGRVNGTYGTTATLGHVNTELPSLGTGARLTALSSSGILGVTGDLAILSSSSFSLEFWYKQSQSVVADRNHLFRPATNGWDGSFFEAYVTGGGSVYCNGIATGPGVSTFGAWHHLVFTRDNTNGALWYLDGNVIAAQPVAGYLPTPGVVTSFGGGGQGGSAFEGMVDEIAIYTNVLTPARIVSHRRAATNHLPVVASFTATPTNGLAPLEVTFSDTSTGAPVYGRYWEFGDGTTVYAGTNTTVVHTFTAPDAIHTVRLTVSGPLNISTNTQTGLIVVDPHTPPAAAFTAAPTSGVAPLTVTFTDASIPGSSGPITSRHWDFGDGAVSTTGTANVTHVYANPGTFDVELIVSDTAGAGTNSQPGLISVEAREASYREAVLRDGPLVYYEMNEVGGTVAVDTMGTVNGTYGAGVVQGQVNVDYPSLGTGVNLLTYGTPGLLEIPVDLRLSTRGEFSLEFWYRQTQSVVAELNQLVRVSGIGWDSSFFECHVMGNGSMYCNGDWTAVGISPFNAWHHLVLTRDSDGNALWYLDGMVIGSQTNSNFLLTPGVTTSFGGGGQGGSPFEGSLDEIAVYTNVLSPARIAAHRLAATNYMPVTARFGAAPTSGPVPLEVFFTDTSTPGISGPITTRDWDFGDGTVVMTNATNLTHVYSSAGIYDVRLVVSDGVVSGTNSRPGLIVVTPTVPLTASFNATPTNGVLPLTVTFTDTSTTGSLGPILSRYWDFGDGTTITTNTTELTHTYTQAGVYDVTLVVSDVGAADTNTQSGLIVVDLPAPPVAAFGAAPTSGEEFLMVTFTDTSTQGPSGPILSRCWDFGDGTVVTTSATNLTHVYTNNGTYSVTLVVSDIVVAGTNTQHDLITVLPPVASYRDAVLRDGPVAYYEFNETIGTVATDTMGVANGTFGVNAVLGVENIELPSLGLGARITTLAGPALLTITNAPVLQTSGSFSVECWYKQTQTVVTGFNQPMRLSDLGLDGSFITCIVLKGGVVYCNGVWTAAGTSPFNVWHHLVLTRDSNHNALWYLDGEVIVSQQISNTLLTPGYATVFGGGGSGESSFEGTMDEIAIYTNVLTPARIAAHYAAASLPVRLPPTPAFSYGMMAVSDGVPSFSFDTVSGFVYGIDYRNTLTGGTWLPLISQPDYPPPDGWSRMSTGEPMMLIDTNTAGQPHRFYRLRSSAP